MILGVKAKTLAAQRSIERTTTSMNRTLERLASGQRIVRPSDDSAGLAVGQSLSTDTRVYSQAVRNVNDGICYLSIREGAAAELETILLRLAELTVQAANGVYTAEQRSTVGVEVSALTVEYNRIIDSTAFNQRKLFEDTALILQAGYGEDGALVLALDNPSSAESLEQVSVAVDGGPPNGNSTSTYRMISGDGRFVVFKSDATNLVSGDVNGASDVFLFDRLSGQTELVSLSTNGTKGDGPSDAVAVSGNGRYVTFASESANLVAGDTNAQYDIFIRDRVTGTTERVSVATAGTQGNNDSFRSAVSDDGRYVFFDSAASNLVAGDANGVWDVFMHDCVTGTTSRVSIRSDGGEATGGNSNLISITPDGRYVSFTSTSTNLVAGDTNGAGDVFIRDLWTGTTERLSVASGGSQLSAGGGGGDLSADGRYVTFYSTSTDVVPGDANGAAEDVFVRDRLTGTTTLVSVNSDGAQGNALSRYSNISGDGRYICFSSAATNLVDGDTNVQSDVFVRDLLLGTTARVSVRQDGTQGDGTSGGSDISRDGTYIFFQSAATNLTSGDTNGCTDVFVAENAAMPKFSLSRLGWLSVQTADEAAKSLDRVQVYLDEVATLRGQMGTHTSRLGSVNTHLLQTRDEYAAAASRIMDADIAEEAAELVRLQVLQNAGSAILAQANMQHGLVLSLLRD